MTGALIKRGSLDTHMHERQRERTPKMFSKLPEAGKEAWSRFPHMPQKEPSLRNVKVCVPNSNLSLDSNPDSP
jgi:hypothetical protein